MESSAADAAAGGRPSKESAGPASQSDEKNESSVRLAAGDDNDASVRYCLKTKIRRHEFLFSNYSENQMNMFYATILYCKDIMGRG